MHSLSNPYSWHFNSVCSMFTRKPNQYIKQKQNKKKSPVFPEPNENWIKAILMIILMVICLNIEYQFRSFNLIVSQYYCSIQYEKLQQNYSDGIVFGLTIVCWNWISQGKAHRLFSNSSFFIHLYLCCMAQCISHNINNT